MNSPSDAAAARAAALQAERERLIARRARRTDRAAVPPSPDQEAWRALGVPPEAIINARHVLRELLTVMPAQGAVRDCLDAPPCGELRTAVVDMLRALPTVRAAEFARDLQGMGFPIVSPQAVPAVRLLAQPEIRTTQIGEAQAVDAGPAWHLYIDALAVSIGQRPMAPQLLVEEAPLMVVSDYLEMAGSEVDPSWWSGRPLDEQHYLMARTRPELLADRQVEALGWHEELHRRRLVRGTAYSPGPDEDEIELFALISAAAAGDAGVLDRLEQLLPEDNASVIRSVRNGAATGTWAADVLEDRGLWNLLAEHLPDEEPIDPENGSFFQWAGFRRAYELTKAGRFADAWAQTQMFPMAGRPVAPFEKEIQNLRAYLLLMRTRADETKSLDTAIRLLTAVLGDKIVRANLKWLHARRRRTRNERGFPDNPYLVLGVEQGASGAEWKAAWRRLRRAHAGDVDALSKVNTAKDLIEELERAGSEGLGEIFAIPLDTKRLAPERGKPWRLLVPAASPLPWQESGTGSADLTALRVRAFTAILDGIA